jgi:hypothetical protein
VSSHATVGTPDANGKPTKSVNSIKVVASLGNPSTPANEADVGLALSLTDVLDRTRGFDYYVGDVQATLDLRITDKLNGSQTADSGTVVDQPLSFTASCVPDLTIGGSTCSVNTSANAISPGLVIERARTMWQVQRIQIFDGGDDGTTATPNDNGLFAVPGLFVP